MRVQSLEQHAKSRVHQMAAAQVSGNAATLVNGIRVQCLDPTIFLEQTHMFSQFNLWLGDVRHLGGVVAVMR